MDVLDEELEPESLDVAAAVVALSDFSAPEPDDFSGEAAEDVLEDSRLSLR